MNRKIILTGLPILLNLSLFAQNFISPDKQWNVRLSTTFGYSTEIYKIEGDSVVGSLLYSKIWVSYDSLETFTFKGLLREESNVVYYIPPDLSEGVLYDFNLEIGDTANVINMFCSDNTIPVTVVNIDTVEYFGIPRKRWQLDGYDGLEEFWVEGIGSLNGLLHTKYWYCIVCPVWELLCFHENDTLRYIMPYETDCYQSTDGVNENQEKDDFSIIPNPVVKGNNVYIETSSVPNSIGIYNSSGLLMKKPVKVGDKRVGIETSGFTPGIYFITIVTNKGKIKTRKLMID